MRKLLTVFLVLFATTAMAATDIVATYKYPDGNMVTIVTRDKDHVRMDTSPSTYMLLQGETVYTVSRDESGQYTVMDLGKMVQATNTSSFKSLFGGGDEEAQEEEYLANYEKTGRREKIAGYTGVVYNVMVKQGGKEVRRDEVVLSTHSDIKKINDAWIALGEKMSQAMGDEMAKSLDKATEEAREKGYGGMLRYGDEMKLHSLKKMSLTTAYYQLPANAQEVQAGQMPDMNQMDQMQQQYEQQQQQYEQQQQYDQQYNQGQQQAEQQYDQGQQQYEQQQSKAGQVLEQDAKDVGSAAHQEAKDQTVEEVKEGVKKLFNSLFD